jgi:hypothetical protein
MNVNKRDFAYCIAIRIRQWWDVAGNGINLHDRARARKNFRALVRKYPEIAKASGFSLDDVTE